MVYKFTVAGDHTYSVGVENGGAWVNNTDECEKYITNKAFKELTTHIDRDAEGRVIARAGGIDMLHNLVAQYGGKAANWVKRSSAEMYHLQTGELGEFHWFENTKDNIGRTQIKWKPLQ